MLLEVKNSLAAWLVISDKRTGNFDGRDFPPRGFGGLSGRDSWIFIRGFIPHLAILS